MMTRKVVTVVSLFICWMFLYSCGPTNEKPNDLEPEYGKLTGIPTLDALSKDIKANPDNMALRVVRCEAYSAEGMLKEAEAEARLIYENDKTNWKAARLLAWTYLENNKSKPAIKVLEQALEIHPDTIMLLLVHAEMNLLVKNYDEALISSEKVLKLSSLNVELDLSSYCQKWLKFLSQGDFEQRHA